MSSSDGFARARGRAFEAPSDLAVGGWGTILGGTGPGRFAGTGHSLSLPSWPDLGGDVKLLDVQTNFDARVATGAAAIALAALGIVLWLRRRK